MIYNMHFGSKRLVGAAIVFLICLTLKINIQKGPGGGMPLPSESFKSFDPEERIEEETKWMRKKLKFSSD